MYTSQNDTEKKAAIERAAAYRTMLSSWAWKDVLRIIEEIKEMEMNRIDNLSLDKLNYSPSIIAHAKGIRAGLQKLMDEINRNLEVQ